MYEGNRCPFVVESLAKSEGAKAMTGIAEIWSSMGGSFSNNGNLGFRLDGFRFCVFFDTPSFDFFLFGFLVLLLDRDVFVGPCDELKLSTAGNGVEKSCWIEI